MANLHLYYMQKPLPPLPTAVPSNAAPYVSNFPLVLEESTFDVLPTPLRDRRDSLVPQPLFYSRKNRGHTRSNELTKRKSVIGLKCRSNCSTYENNGFGTCTSVFDSWTPTSSEVDISAFPHKANPKPITNPKIIVSKAFDSLVATFGKTIRSRTKDGKERGDKYQRERSKILLTKITEREDMGQMEKVYMVDPDEKSYPILLPSAGWI